MALLSRRWLCRDVVVESCWRWRYRVDVDHGVGDDHANVTPGLIRILILGKEKIIK
jgi:hypothetical protein